MKQEWLDSLPAPWELAGVPQDTAVLLALSGGADSCALLHLLAQQAKRDGFSLYAAHVHHGIRGAEADRDQAFCEDLAERYGIGLFLQKADVPALARKSGKGLEETAREVRYRFFEELMKRESIGLLVTAHHADDNLETVLFRLCRGSGTRGLCGITRVRPFAQGQLVRPLLSVTREQILLFCEQNKLAYVTDSTNGDTAYTRNRLRAEVVPILQELFGAPQQKVLEASLALSEDEAYLSLLADRVLKKAETEQGLLRQALIDAPMPVCSRVLMKWVERYTGHCPERIHLEALFELLKGKKSGTEVALSGDFVGISELGLLRIIRRVRTQAALPILPLAEGEWVLLDGRVRIRVQPWQPNTKIHNLSTESCITLNKDSAIISSGLYWRLRKEGDVILSEGMHKKLRKQYGAADIPPHRRELIPLLCDENGIVWAPFVGVRDGVPVQSKKTDADDGIRISVELLSVKL